MSNPQWPPLPECRGLSGDELDPAVVYLPPLSLLCLPRPVLPRGGSLRGQSFVSGRWSVRINRPWQRGRARRTRSKGRSRSPGRYFGKPGSEVEGATRKDFNRKVQPWFQPERGVRDDIIYNSKLQRCVVRACGGGVAEAARKMKRGGGPRTLLKELPSQQ